MAYSPVRVADSPVPDTLGVSAAHYASSSSPAAAAAAPSASPYEGDLGDNGFWRGFTREGAAGGAPLEGSVVPRQRVFNAPSASSPPHTLRRPQSRQRPAYSAAGLRADRLAQHTNCCGVLGPMHAAKVIAERLGDPVPGLLHCTHSLEPGTQLIASLRIADAFSDLRRKEEDEDLEWRKRFWLTRVLQGRERHFASTQRKATRAALRASGEAAAAAAPFIGFRHRSESPPLLDPRASGTAGSAGAAAFKTIVAAVSAAVVAGDGPDFVGGLGLTARSLPTGSLSSFRVPSPPSPLSPPSPPSLPSLQQQQQQQHAASLLQRKPVYTDRNIPWRRFGGSVNDLLVAEGRAALPQLPPASPSVSRAREAGRDLTLYLALVTPPLTERAATLPIPPAPSPPSPPPSPTALELAWASRACRTRVSRPRPRPRPSRRQPACGALTPPARSPPPLCSLLPSPRRCGSTAGRPPQRPSSLTASTRGAARRTTRRSSCTARCRACFSLRRWRAFSRCEGAAGAAKRRIAARCTPVLS